ncbi:MAG: hypothetical protein WD768_07570 [Phycisphaeraceae bacterium]
MMQSPNQVVEEHLAATKELRHKLKDPKEARAFLLKAGIIVRVKGKGKPRYQLARR